MGSIRCNDDVTRTTALTQPCAFIWYTAFVNIYLLFEIFFFISMTINWQNDRKLCSFPNKQFNLTDGHSALPAKTVVEITALTKRNKTITSPITFSRVYVEVHWPFIQFPSWNLEAVLVRHNESKVSLMSSWPSKALGIMLKFT